MIKIFFIKLLIFCIRNLYEVYVVAFFIKYLTQPKKKALIVHFSKFWGAEISADPQNDSLQWDTQKKVKKAKKSKKWILYQITKKKKLKYKNKNLFIKNRSGCILQF